MSTLAVSQTLAFLMEGLSIWHMMILLAYLLVSVATVSDIWRRDMPQETKLLWTLVVFLVPLFLGVVVYFLFGRKAGPPQPPTY